MRLELAERLRCPGAHTATPLIVVAQRTAERDLVAAMLGCPVCHLEARIVDGDVRFTDASGDRPASPDAPRADRSAGPVADLERVIALLGLAEPGGSVLLTGRYAALAAALADTSDVSVVLMHAAAGGAPAGVPAVASVHGVPGSVPFIDGTFRAVALDMDLPPSFIADAVRGTATGGRVLADARVPSPQGVKELARDDTEWVAARESGGAIVELKRRV
ncbi:MAG: hypothetical protein K8S21_06575 [Gemmatimonadetes bacterium]|nr:hypothetical protein [Gemmatimonadota bacterium]